MSFDLADVLKGLDNVPGSGTWREQIEYIDIALIDADPKNFYSLSGIDELAANIELLGLQQPLRVSPEADKPGRVMVVSGHRRLAALKLLAKTRPEFSSVPCIRETAGGSEAMRELRLIYANSDTRHMSSAEISQQAERVEALLYSLKEEGVEFPGRMRDHVAEACKVSKSKLARLKVIRDGLKQPQFRIAWKKGELSETTAYTLAQQTPARQAAIYGLCASKNGVKYLYENDVSAYVRDADELESRTCKKTGDGKCANAAAMLAKIHESRYSYSPCGHVKCCIKCDSLATCKSACPLLADKIKLLKADKRAEAARLKALAEEKARPRVEKLTAMWERFGQARAIAGKSIEEAIKASGVHYFKSDDKKFEEKEQGRGISEHDQLPYGYSMYLSDVEYLTGAADCLGCSVDYLLCRTDNRNGAREPRPFKWQTGEPARPTKAVGRFMVDEIVLEKICKWYNGKWHFVAGQEIDAECVGWFPLPEEDAE